MFTMERAWADDTTGIELDSDHARSQVHEQFNDPSADITIESSDGIIFKVFSQDLNAYAGKQLVSPTDNIDYSPSTKLSESSAILEILLGYTQKQRLPSLAGVAQTDFPMIAQLAEAAEKYEVFSAMEIIKYEMRNAATKHAVIVLAYALRYGYRDIADVAAPETIGVPLSTIMVSLKPETFSAWMLYREGWLDALKAASNEPKPVMHPGGRESCTLWPEFKRHFVAHFGANPHTLLSLEEMYLESKLKILPGCKHCLLRAETWKNRIQMGIAGLPKFTTFL